MTFDIDIIFEKNYISECVNKIKKDYFQVIYSKMLDASSHDIDKNTEVISDYYKIKNNATNREYLYIPDIVYNFRHGSSICFTLKYSV